MVILVGEVFKYSLIASLTDAAVKMLRHFHDLCLSIAREHVSGDRGKTRNEKMLVPEHTSSDPVSGNASKRQRMRCCKLSMTRGVRWTEEQREELHVSLREAERDTERTQSCNMRKCLQHRPLTTQMQLCA